jgi:HD-GYP domain-containing protein (c-di-GMP phosphodiesterase class II)
MQDEIVEAMVRALEGVDSTARAHGDRVSMLAVETGRRLGMSTPALQALRLSSRLHDVGLLAGQQGRSADYHAAIGARILERLPDPLIAAFVRAHHERWDGKGEPDHKQGSAIPLGARVLAAAEIYDSVTEGIPPYQPHSPKEAESHLISLGGSVLDPQVVVVLLRIVSEQRTDLGAAG